MKWGILGILAALIAGQQYKQIETGYKPPIQPDIYKPPDTYYSPPETGTVQPDVFKTFEAAPRLPGMDVFKQPTGEILSTPEIGFKADILIARPTVSTTQPVKPLEAIPDTISSITRKKSTGWIWWGAPGGPVTSRQPTQEEIDSGLGCPEVPGIWTYPMESGMDLRYCSNMDCPSNNWETTPTGERLAPTPAQLEDQGLDQPAGKRWFCRVCRTYQG